MDFTDRVICVGYPSSELIDVRFHTDLFALATQTASFANIRIGLTNAVSSRIVANRNLIVDNARQMGATDILWIDTDQKFPINALVRLLMHEKDIACATTCRRKFGNRAPIGIPEDRTILEPFQKLVPMRVIGLPFMLTKLSVFDKMEKPYFAEPPRALMIEKYGEAAKIPYEAMDEYVMPEDEYFCFNAIRAGMQIWCDMELSMEIGHIGSETYYIEQSQPPPTTKVDIDLITGTALSDEQYARSNEMIGE